MSSYFATSYGSDDWDNHRSQSNDGAYLVMINDNDEKEFLEYGME